MDEEETVDTLDLDLDDDFSLLLELTVRKEIVNNTYKIDFLSREKHTFALTKEEEIKRLEIAFAKNKYLKYKNKYLKLKNNMI